MVSQSHRSLFNRILNIGVKLDDAQDIRLQKSLLSFGNMCFIVAGFLWSIFYFFFREPFAALIPFSYSVISLLSVLRFKLTHQYRFFRDSQLVLILLLPFFLMIALGGFVESSMVIVWSFLCPMGALLFTESRQAPRWLVVYLGVITLSGILEPFIRFSNNIPESMKILFFVLNIGAVSILTFVLLHYFVGQKELAYRFLHAEQDRSESLLLNVLPHEIAVRLKNGEHTIADHHASVSILFADLAGFTPLSTVLSPNGMVELLNEIYSHFDSLIEKYGAEKIRTIGDNYMVAAGAPAPRDDHAHVLARLALDMTSYVASLDPVAGRRLAFRIGINSGPVVAGVIGHKKFAYDVWGDTVNTASRMESQGQPGKIQITQYTYDLIKEDFICESNGSVRVKGKGQMETWFLVGCK